MGKPIVTLDTQNGASFRIWMPDGYGCFTQPNLPCALTFVDQFFIAVDDRRTFDYQISTAQVGVACFKRTPVKLSDMRTIKQQAIAAAKAYLAEEQARLAAA